MATYKRGSSGAGVSELQRKLNANGANLAVDGVYGANTEAAVRSYQQQNGLSVDGIAGEKTFAALNGTSGTSSAQPTTTTQTAAQRLAEYDSKKPEAYQSNYRSQINALLDQIQNREKFNYDFASDPLYQQYAQRYQSQGKMAMEDTIGQAAALTGGYGNTYAQTVGQQQYNQYLEGLNDIIPELRDSAYQMYRDEGDDMSQRLSLYQQLEGTDYDRYMDEYDKWQTERNYLYQLAQDEEEKRRWEAEYALSQQAARSSGGGGSSRSYSSSGSSGVSDSVYNAFSNDLENAVKGKSTLDAMKYYYTTQIQNSMLSQEQKDHLMRYFRENVQSWYNAKRSEQLKNRNK